MDEFIGWLNSTSELFMAWAVRMLVQSSALILALVVLDHLLRRRVKVPSLR